MTPKKAPKASGGAGPSSTSAAASASRGSPTAVGLTPLMERFILHWGEMGTRWGVNRTVAQIHALLYVWPDPLNAEQIAGTLSVARSNVSTSLKELQSWGIVRTVHVLGDRRDHFESIQDVWEMFEKVLAERKRREIDPTIAMLKDVITEADAAYPKEEHTRERLQKLLEFFETMDRLYGQLKRLPNRALLRLSSMTGSMKRFFGMK